MFRFCFAVNSCTVFTCLFSAVPEGRPGMSDLPCSLQSQGCHLISLYYFLSCSSAKSFYSVCLVFFFFYRPVLLTYFKKFSIRDWLFFFCMAPVKQLGECCYACLLQIRFFFFLILWSNLLQPLTVSTATAVWNILSQSITVLLLLSAITCLSQSQYSYCCLQ